MSVTKVINLRPAKRAFDFIRLATYGKENLELESFVDPYRSILSSVIRAVSKKILVVDIPDAEFNQLVADMTIEAMGYQVVPDTTGTKEVVEKMLIAVYNSVPSGIDNAYILVVKYNELTCIIKYIEGTEILMEDSEGSF